jgi:hypothetical protein
MPILTYFCVAGSVLLGLLFAVDAMVPAREPLRIGSEFHGLPQPAPRAAKDPHELPILRTTPAPEPDMTAAAVVAAQPPKSAMVAAASPAPAAHEARAQSHTAQASATPASAPKKIAQKQQQKRVVRYRPRQDYGPSYAWSAWGGGGGWGDYRGYRNERPMGWRF